MNHYPPSILNLIKEFSRLPGIGVKTAERLAMHVLRTPKNEALALAQSITDLKEKVRLCSKCYGLSDSEICGICADPDRNSRVLCVVEQPAEMSAIEKSGAFSGYYHILQGALAPMDGVGPEDIRLNELMTRIRQEGITEVVLATGTNVEGESTASYIAGMLKNDDVSVTRIATGVPMGGEIKYVDQATLKRAMETRHAV